MANTHGNPLVTLGKRILGFSTSSSGCCGAPEASATSAAAIDTGAKPEAGEGSTPPARCCSTASTSVRADHSA